MTKRIKILFTIPNFDTAGSGRVVYDLIAGLDRTRFAPEICCFHGKGAYFETIKSLGVPIHFFEFTAPYRPFLSLPFRVWRIARFFKQHQFDVIHSWHWSSDFTEPLAARLAGVPFVYTKKAMGWGNRAWRWRSQLSRKIIAINTDMQPQFFSAMAEKVCYIPLGVAVDYFKPLPKRYTTPEGLVFSDTDFVVVTVANLVPVKGIEVLLEAVGMLDDARVKVLVVGSTESAYARALQDQYASEQVHFVGKQLDVRPYLAVADVFVLPTLSIGEGLPVALLEAMSSKRIAIGSKVSGIKDVLRLRTDLLFEAGQVSDLSSKIKRILEMSHKERGVLQKQMRLITLEDFKIESFVENHEKLYTLISK
ncbi:glycosyltransferase [Gaetbulibacter jejuensis]|uniref:Glycosyltransferase family 4 protein n=1 Tax=Gaetbulibacter jejuensis TaxID=584607 RepID=A0ABN1JW61_9FLAO